MKSCDVALDIWLGGMSVGRYAAKAADGQETLAKAPAGTAGIQSQAGPLTVRGCVPDIRDVKPFDYFLGSTNLDW